ncbi:MAG: putative bifunctional diguanylate cyclase/phosphodiesterase [Steroidobacterales bacterium]
MSPTFLKRNRGWLPAALVLVVVLVAGSRLLVLSVRQNAQSAQKVAWEQATSAARAIESQIQSLADAANREAERAAAANSAANAPAALRSLVPMRNAFWISANGVAVASDQSSPTAVNGIISEWSAALRSAAAPSVLGPTRQGSQWLIAALAPILPVVASDRSKAVGWSVVYTDLDQLLSAIHLGRLVNAGYDFALAQIDAGSGQSRTFVSSNTGPFTAPIALPIRLPAGYTSAMPGSFLQLLIRQRGGWYPAGEIATEIGVLAVLAWLLAFGAYDMTRSLHRLRTALSTYRARLHGVREQLAAESEKRRELQKSIDFARYHDGFTGLPNRRYLVDQLDRALREVRTRQRQRIGVILIDIARFRLINDTLGHTVGDELMVQVARRFEKAAAAFECVLARWSGDQFALLILDVAFPDAAVAFAGVLQDALHAPFELRRHNISVTACMGLTCIESGTSRAEDVLREADIALSVAKKHETRRVILYAPAMGGDAASIVSLEAELHLAVKQNDLRLLFQPIVDLHSYRMVGAEALLRWRHPAEGMMLPDRFLGIAEEAGLMVNITRQIILRVCMLAAQWRRSLPEAQFYLSINLSASALRDPDLSGYVAQVLHDTGVSAALLKFEVTEAALISNVGAAREALERLHQLGVQVMLDDFGTGFSSLNYLQMFPLDYVKIDRPVVTRTLSDRANSGMMSAMLQMASSLGLTAIAENIETEAAADALRKIGCAFGQGYFFSEPVQAEVALQRLRGEPFVGRKQMAASDAATSTGAPPLQSPEDDSPTLMIPIESEGQDEVDEGSYWHEQTR